MTRALFAMAARRAMPRDFDESGWTPLLALADRTHLTLYLRGITGLPAFAEDEIESRYQRNLARRRRLRETFAEVLGAFRSRGVPFVLLKGFTHENGFGIDPATRVQFDLDLWVAPAQIAAARETLRELGYHPHGRRSLSEEHGRPWVRASDWHWRGDYFDPEMPVPIELHDSLWSPAHDRIAIPGLDRFWDRRIMLADGETQERPLALAPPDRIAFAALHALRHILRQDARPAHVLELARFLEIAEPRFWEEWRGFHPGELRAFQAIAFCFAQAWFGCPMPEPVAEEWRRQPVAVTAWFRDFAWSPVESAASKRKAALWLHLALIESRRDRIRVFFDTLIPARLPHREEDAPYRARLTSRLRYHTGALAPAVWNGLRWLWRRTAASTASQISDWNRPSV